VNSYRDWVPSWVFHNYPPANAWLTPITVAGRSVHITRARAGARQACARRETRLAFSCAHKYSSTLLQLLARFRRVWIRIFTRRVYRL
jgi:hypothetical protein